MAQLSDLSWITKLIQQRFWPFLENRPIKMIAMITKAQTRVQKIINCRLVLCWKMAWTERYNSMTGKLNPRKPRNCPICILGTLPSKHQEKGSSLLQGISDVTSRFVPKSNERVRDLTWSLRCYIMAITYDKMKWKISSTRGLCQEQRWFLQETAPRFSLVFCALLWV